MPGGPAREQTQDRLIQRIVELQGQFLALIRSFSETIDARDSYSQGHSQRVARYALAIGQEFSFTPQRQERLEMAALLHDIGKLGVEAYILAKPTSLDELEMAAVKYHPLLGVRILESVTGLADLIPFIRHHHERIDGRGYPDGLSGEQIPLEARILAVADSFEAMTSQRPYRKTKSFAQAVQELRSGAGRQFDSEVVEAFARALERDCVGAGLLKS